MNSVPVNEPAADGEGARGVRGRHDERVQGIEEPVVVVGLPVETTAAQSSAVTAVPPAG